MKKLFVLALAALAMAMSCQKNENAQDPTRQPVMRTITCTIADSDPTSKVAISATDGKTTWEEGDEIFIHGKYFGPTYTKTVALKSEDISDDGKTASITVDLSDVTPNNAASYQCEYFAAYPASSVGGYGNGDNMYYYNCFNETNKPLMAGYLDGNTIQFFNICGVLSFLVSGDYDQISFQGNSDEDISYSYYRVKIVPSEKNYKHTCNGASKTIVQDIIADGATENRIYFPNGASFDAGFTIYFMKSGSPVKTLSTTKSVEIPRNSYRPMGVVTSYLEDYVAPSTSTHTYDSEVFTSVTNLGETQTANCYVIDAAGSYKFPVVKGNSSTSAGNIFGVELLWETWNNNEDVTENSVIAAVDFDGPSNYVYFKTPATRKPGNAVIAAKDNLGNIIWSWHIWVPESAITTDSYGDVLGAVAMDRNLGALVAATAGSAAPITSLGLLYQWGRKDPFPGAASFGSSPSKATVSKNATSKASGTITLEQAIANPTLMGYTKDGDWIDTSDETLWQDAGKTIYDPCPVGYRVPIRNAGKAMWSDDLSTKTGWSESSSAYSFTLGDPAAVFPFAGYIDDDGLSLKYAGSRSLYWTSRRSGSVSSYGADVRFGDRHKLSSPARARAGSVRCVAE